MKFFLILMATPFIIAALPIIGIYLCVKSINDSRYKKLEAEVLKELGIPYWNVSPRIDKNVEVKSRKSLESYNEIKFFKDNPQNFAHVKSVLERKSKVAAILKEFIDNNQYTNHPHYRRLYNQAVEAYNNAGAYGIRVSYISSANNNLGSRDIIIDEHTLNKIKNNPSLLMSKSEYNNYIKEQQKIELVKKQRKYYDKVNDIIKSANEKKEIILIKGDQERLDNLIEELGNRTNNVITKIKKIDSIEWIYIDEDIKRINEDITQIINSNQRILEYYDSPEFLKIKTTCEKLMSTQREFNEYIIEKIDVVSKLFGRSVERSETIYYDEYNYNRTYKKTINPFTAEVSSQVFSSAENKPIEYVIKYFYPNKEMYQEQILNLYQFMEELETLRDAKLIIENYKAEYQEYFKDVPSFIMEHDEASFYSRLGFAHIDESILNVEYKFVYTSSGGKAQRSFPVPMTEERIIELIKALESKLTMESFVKEQRALMTRKLRQHIKERDNYTCCHCHNSIYKEPNLLLEIDHIIPLAKGGCTTEDNLQTLCWKCNRAKSDHII